MKKILLAAFILFSSLVNAQNIYLPISYNSTSLDFYSGNLNNLTAIGFYKGRHNVNAPDNGYWYIAVEAYDNTGGNVAGWTKQVATALGSENIYKPGTTFVRTQVGADGWTPWMMQLQVNADGNVGIGTASPSAKLEVNGDFKFTSEYNRLAFPVSLGYGGGITGDDGVYKRLTLFHGNSIALETGANELSASNTRLFINETGNIGIGTSSPAYKLDVNGATNISGFLNVAGENEGFTIGNDAYRNRIAFGDGATLPAAFRLLTAYNAYANLEAMGAVFSGDVAIGVGASQKELTVNGEIKTRKIKVTQTGWADYVFDSSYQLPALAHVETFIKENKHLPEVPSAAEVKKEGVDLGDNQVLLLKKIEELTLYIIQQNKEIIEQNKEVEKLKKRVADLEAK